MLTVHLIEHLSPGLTQPLQNCQTLNEGFAELSDKYTRSTAVASALENEVGGYRDESDRLKSQVTALRQELREQNETLERRFISVTSALHAVRISVQRSLQQAPILAPADIGWACREGYVYDMPRDLPQSI